MTEELDDADAEESTVALDEPEAEPSLLAVALEDALSDDAAVSETVKLMLKLGSTLGDDDVDDDTDALAAADADVDVDMLADADIETVKGEADGDGVTLRVIETEGDNDGLIDDMVPGDTVRLEDGERV